MVRHYINGPISMKKVTLTNFATSLSMVNMEIAAATFANTTKILARISMQTALILLLIKIVTATYVRASTNVTQSGMLFKEIWTILSKFSH